MDRSEGTRAGPATLVLRSALAGLVFLGGAYLVVTWTEAEKEIRILCSMFTPGKSEDQVVGILRTGNFLRYRADETPVGWAEAGSDEGRQGRASLRVESPYNLGASSCPSSPGRIWSTR